MEKEEQEIIDIIESEKQRKLVGKKSVFSQKMFEKYDIPARKIISSIFGEDIIDNPDIYGEDMIITIPECEYKYLELQVCADWQDVKFPYDKPYIYERKIKFSDDTLFMVFNRKMTMALLFAKKYIKNEPKRVKKYSREYKYEIEWKDVLQVYLKHFNKKELMAYK